MLCPALNPQTDGPGREVLIGHLDEDAGIRQDSSQGNLITIASAVRSHHAEKIVEALQKTILAGSETVEDLSKVDESEDTGLAPVHYASRSGIRANLSRSALIRSRFLKRCHNVFMMLLWAAVWSDQGRI